MIDALFNSPNYLAAKKSLDAVVLRHEAIAANISNLETPGYRRVDLAPSFAAELDRACAAGDTHQLATLKPTLAVDPNAVSTGRDGNTVNLETEIMKLNENMLAHTLETQLISSALQKLQLAISGKS